MRVCVCVCVCVYVCMCVCVCFIEILYEQLREYFLVESYVKFSGKANAAIFILIGGHFGGLRAPYLHTPNFTYPQFKNICMNHFEYIFWLNLM